MKTEIYLPNPIHHAAEKLAKDLGISLSELYTAALIAYVFEHEKKGITEKLDDVYMNEDATIKPELATGQATIVGNEQW